MLIELMAAFFIMQLVFYNEMRCSTVNSKCINLFDYVISALEIF